MVILSFRGGKKISGRIPIFRYAIANIFRNKRRSLTAIVGVVLAVTLLAGVNISIDTTSNSMLLRSLESVPYDYIVSTNNGSYNEIIDTLKIEDVLNAEVTSDIGYVTIGRWGTEEMSFGSLTGVRQESKDYLAKIVDASFESYREFIDMPTIEGFTGNFDIQKDGILLQEHQANTLEVGVGDTVYLENMVYWWNGTGEQNTTYYYNMTVSGIISFQTSESFGSIDISSFLPNTFVHIDDRDAIIEALNLSYWSFYGEPVVYTDGFDGAFYGANYSYYVWVDRTKFVTLGDLDNVERNYVVMERSLKRALQDIGLDQNEFSITTASIIPVIEEVNTELMIIRLVFLVILIPAIALGVYLSLIAVEIGMTRRMRELGILKTRGATSRQLLGMLLTESMILGIIAGVIGIILGILVSQLFLSIVPVTQYFVQDIYGIFVSGLSITLVMIFSVIMIAVASYRPAKRITSQPGIEMLRYRAGAEVKVPYRPTVDIIFVALAIFTFILMIVLKSTTSGGFYDFLLMLNPVLLVMTPLSAFLLIIGLTRLLTRGTTKIYDKASKAAKFMTKDLWHIVNRNIVRNPRRTSSVCLIIAIGLAFGIVVSTFIETQEKYAERVVIGNVGGDLSVVVGLDTNMSFADNLSAVEGVELVTPVAMLFSSNFEYITAINSSAYYDIVTPEQYFFAEGDARTAIEALGTEGNAIINTKLADTEYLAIGDAYDTAIYYTWDIDSDPESYTFTVVGIAKTLPGLGEGFMPYSYLPQIYVDLDSLNLSALSNASLGLKFLIKVDDGHDPSMVADEISDSYPSDVVYITVLQEERERFQEHPIIGSIYNFLMPVFLFVVLIITVGLGLVMYIAAVERENEFAGFIARGASTKQVGSLLFGEGMTITIVGVIIGIITGLLAAFMINELISFITSSGGGQEAFLFMGGDVVIERSFVVSWLTLVLILITILALVIAGFIATLKVKRIDVARALRERGE